MDPGDVAVIGGGPAGIAAAIQISRSGFKPVLFEKSELGGLLRNANLVENYPGFPGGVPGTELVRLIVEQYREYRLETVYDEVVFLSYRDGFFTVEAGGERRFFRAVIVATGTKPKRVDVLESAVDAGLAFYEVQELSHVSGERVAVVGGGDAAFDYALRLSRENKVLLFNRSPRPGCIPVLYSRVKENKNIDYFEATGLVGADVCDGLTVRCRRGDGSVVEHNVSYVLIAVGRKPALDFLDGDVDFDPLIGDGRCFLVGDVKNGACRQVAIAAGDGVKAAMMIAERMRES